MTYSSDIDELMNEVADQLCETFSTPKHHLYDRIPIELPAYTLWVIAEQEPNKGLTISVHIVHESKNDLDVGDGEDIDIITHEGAKITVEAEKSMEVTTDGSIKPRTIVHMAVTCWMGYVRDVSPNVHMTLNPQNELTYKWDGFQFDRLEDVQDAAVSKFLGGDSLESVGGVDLDDDAQTMADTGWIVPGEGPVSKERARRILKTWTRRRS